MRCLSAVSGDDVGGELEIEEAHIDPDQWRQNITQFEFIQARGFNRLKASIDTG
jgi:hypothetical protein